MVTGSDPSPLYRDAVGDECIYVESGTGTVESVFGASYRTGDYVLVRPARPTTGGCPMAEPLRALCIEANSHIAPASRYLSRFGQLLEHAPYCERDLRAPTEPLLVEGNDVEVLVKHRMSQGVATATCTRASFRCGRLGLVACIRTRST